MPLVRRRAVLLLAATVLLPLRTLDAGQPPAQVEVRDYAIFEDGAAVGTARMQIGEAAGSFTMKVKYEIRLKFLQYTYVRSGEATETWRSGRLEDFDGVSESTGRRVKVSLKNQQNRSDVVIDNVRAAGPITAWSTYYWRLPASEFRQVKTMAIDANNGKPLGLQLHSLPVADMQVGKSLLTCTRYRLMGDADDELWFDANERLVKRVYKENGHRMELRLTDIGADASRPAPVATAPKVVKPRR